MARRSASAEEKRPQMEKKFYIYLGFFAMFGTLGVFLWLFGVDFFFINIGAGLTPLQMLWVAGAALVIEEIYSIRYNLAHFDFRKKKKQKPSPLLYIPYISSYVYMKPIPRIISLVGLGAMTLMLLIIFTPVARLLPIGILVEFTSFAIPIILVGFGTSVLARGFSERTYRKEMQQLYLNYSQDESDDVTNSSLVEFLYFVPIMRMMALAQDKSYLATVKLTRTQYRQMKKGV